jgi:hypothetical protein
VTELEVIGGTYDGFKHTIEMEPCTEKNYEAFYPAYPEQKERIDRHKAANQFFCPNAFDLNFYGQYFSA